jgi:hypothetical protein
VYGAGKSSVAEEIADALEARGARFGAVDLDWLMWFGVPGVEPESLRRVFLANLAAVVANYRLAGVIHFVLPGRCAIAKRWASWRQPPRCRCEWFALLYLASKSIIV